MLGERPAYRCALCRREREHVRRLVAGPHAGALICQDCIERLGIEPSAGAETAPPDRASLDYSRDAPAACSRHRVRRRCVSWSRLSAHRLATRSDGAARE